MANVLSGLFRAGSPRSLRTFRPGHSAHRLLQLCNLGGMSMNIQRKNSDRHFRKQSERKKTLVSYN